MSESQKLYRLLRQLRFTPEQARYSTRRLIACKQRIDQKYSDSAQESPFFLSQARA